jgi:hypothetical protein
MKRIVTRELRQGQNRARNVGGASRGFTLIEWPTLGFGAAALPSAEAGFASARLLELARRFSNQASRIFNVRITVTLALAIGSTAIAEPITDVANAEPDLIGEQELASRADPSFDSVSQHYPAMKQSREVVGVKDNPHKIDVEPDGSLSANDETPKAFFKVGDYRFGASRVFFRKKLLDGWMPIVVMSDRHDKLELEETVFGWSQGFSPDEPLVGYVQFRATNPTDSPCKINLQLVLALASNIPPPLNWQINLPALGSQIVSIRLPSKIFESTSGVESTSSEVATEEFQNKLGEVVAYWDKLLAGGSRFEIPEPRVQNAYRAWIAYNFLNVAKRNGVYEVCDGSGFYTNVFGYSAALYCNAFDLLGYHDLSETYCDSLLSFMQTNGLLDVNFGDTDTGTTLWMMAEHYRLTQNADWLHRVAPKMRLMCQWILQQRHAALAQADKGPITTKGLIRYKPYCDLNHPTADYFSNGYLWKGLEAAARVFAEIGLKNEAAKLQAESNAYLKDIHESMDAAVFADRGMNILPMMPDTHELWKAHGSASGYYSLVASCMLETGVLAWNDPKAKLVVHALEQRGGLSVGLCQFDNNQIDHAYTCGYWMNCLQGDEVQRVILGLYGSIAYGMSRDTFSAVECTAIRTGENCLTLPHTYSNTQQLRLLRNMLVREDGRTLWLGQAIPCDWLTAGKHVAVSDAPTHFGAVSYSITAHADGTLRVSLDPPRRTAPTEIALRLRDPKLRKIARVRADRPAKITFSNDTVRLRELNEQLVLDITFQ